MGWNKDNTPDKWSEGKELFDGVKEKAKYNPETGAFENIIYKEGEKDHFHGWTNPSSGQAGGEKHPNKKS